MPSTFGRIETLFRGLQAQQRAVDTTNHNIANAATEGYARQRVDLTTTPPYTVSTFNRYMSSGQVGTGVAVASINRLRDGFLDAQYRVQSQKQGAATTQARAYRELEAVYNEPSSAGVSSAIDRFWGSWQALVNRPDDPSARALVVEEGRGLATTINRVRTQIESQQDNAAQSAASKVDEVNALAREIADLNMQITSTRAVGQQPNDQMDRRDMLLDKLAELADTNNVITPDGATNVYIGGRALVDRDNVNTLKLDNTGGMLSVVWQRDNAVADVETGTLGALVELHNVDLPDALDDLATLRDALADQVNAQHRTGYGLNDPLGAPPARDFFEVLPNDDLQVRSEITSKPDKIAAAGISGAPGNADNALALTNLRNSRTMNGGTATIDEYYNTMVARVGGRAHEAINSESTQGALVETVDRQRREVSEVSLDEEAANLIKHQQSYAAAARAMTVVDSMLDTIINNMGLTGR